MKIEIEIDDAITQAAFDNAVDVGIAHWINEETEAYEDGSVCRIEDSPEYGGEDITKWHHLKVTFRADVDGAGVEDYEVTAKKMIECLPAFLKKYPHLCAGQYLGSEYDGHAMSDDAWFQFAAFGDVVFG